MSEKPRPPLKHCVVCGVAMMASKSDETLPHYDIFNCYNCGSSVTYLQERNHRKPEK